MSRFDAAWLDLREPADHRSRNPLVIDTLREWRSGRGVLQLVDLGAGTGANARLLAPALAGAQHWRLLDNDAELLGGLAGRARRWARASGYAVEESNGAITVSGDGLRCEFVGEHRDISRDWVAMHLSGADVVSASALMDLVSERWLVALAERCAGNGAAVVLTLNYDGRIEFEPPLPGDATLRALLNRHQAGDKGFGPALGPRAGAAACAQFERLGFRVISGTSDWRLGADDTVLQERLLEGWVRAAREMAPAAARTLAEWLNERRARVTARQSRLTVGHVDLVALPPGMHG